MGEVILGMPGPWAKNYHELADHYTTKVGGLPDWPIDKVNIRSDLLKCRACGSSLFLVIQVYAPIWHDTLNIEERTIYVFGCAKPKCANDPLSWCAIRVQKSSNDVELRSAVKEVSPSRASAGSVSNSNYLNLWQNGSDEENDDDVDLEELRRAFSEAANQASHSKKKNGHKQSKSIRKCRLGDTNTPVIPCFYIYSQKESSTGAFGGVGNILASLNLKDKEKDSYDHKEEEESWEEEGYEYDRALHVDRTYLKFMKRMNAYPEQCFRYSYGGKPLLATRGIEEPRKCEICSEPRHYEMQLMPPLLFFLGESSGDSTMQATEGWNWMTLVVYTCSKSCSTRLDQDKSDRSSNGWIVAEEAVILQFEEPLQGSAQVGYLS